ncbi:PhzF family phenazine biosynthesis isomerase [Leifsonia kafniensis]|uniref:PhzF family phenazine biosynthesis isomerase n=1 Tax=Leifsonia kafniensis TaxID=475957 RepID=A0ABP7K8E4_9MICO
MNSTSTAVPLVLRYTAFPAPAASADEARYVGGNPAGVVLDAAGLSDAAMQRIAADIGYSETAFVTETTTDIATTTTDEPATATATATAKAKATATATATAKAKATATATADATAETRRSIRYFSPGAEVPFCGHATIATAIALAERTGTGRFTFDTPIGAVVIQTSTEAGHIVAAFTSVVPEVKALDPAVRTALLALLGLAESDLDERFPLLAAYAGNWHPLVFVRDLATFDALTFDPVDARRMMDAEGWAGTISVLHAPAEFNAGLNSQHEFEARNVFPVGTITEDPATGSAAASLGGYLRETGLLATPARVLIHQGRHVGRPSLLTVDIPAAGGIVVSGTAVPIV